MPRPPIWCCACATSSTPCWSRADSVRSSAISNCLLPRCSPRWNGPASGLMSTCLPRCHHGLPPASTRWNNTATLSPDGCLISARRAKWATYFSTALRLTRRQNALRPALTPPPRKSSKSIATATRLSTSFSKYAGSTSSSPHISTPCRRSSTPSPVRFTPPTTRLSLPPDASPLPTPICKTYLSAPTTDAKYAAHSSPTTVAFSCRPITPRLNCD